MFDSVAIHSPRQPEVHYYEYRAPTDQSVALLREMEAAAEKRVLYSARLESNEFKCDWRVIEETYSMSIRAVCRFDLNGTAHTVEVPIERVWAMDKRAVAEKVCSAVQRALAEQITLPLFLKAATRTVLG